VTIRPAKNHAQPTSEPMRARGFTLIELAIVLVVLAIVAAQGLPMLGDYVQNASVRRAANDVHQAATLARTEAIKRNVRTELRVTATGWSVFDVSANPAVQIAAGALAGGVTTDAAVVGFGTNGRTFPVGAQATMNMRSPAGTCGSTVRCAAVRIAAGGTAVVCDPTKSAGSYGACS
jgi:type IV fimbrial biogenesis protein FimT